MKFLIWTLPLTILPYKELKVLWNPGLKRSRPKPQISLPSTPAGRDSVFSVGFPCGVWQCRGHEEVKARMAATDLVSAPALTGCPTLAPG